MIIKAKLCRDNISNEVFSILVINENEQEIFVPVDDANTMYQEYLEWLAEGNTPEPADN